MDQVSAMFSHIQDDGLAVRGSSTLRVDQNVKILVATDTMVFAHPATFDCADCGDILGHLWLCTFHQRHGRPKDTESLTNLRTQISANTVYLFYTIC